MESAPEPPASPPPPLPPAPPVATASAAKKPAERPAVPALDVQHLTHIFRNHRAVDDLSFSLAKGSIHGFVGPNGAGKTTTLKVIATLLRPQFGAVRVFGLDVD